VWDCIICMITVTFNLHTLVVLYQGICQVHCLDKSLLVVVAASRIMLLVFIISTINATKVQR
jgi:hypothetical protein